MKYFRGHSSSQNIDTAVVEALSGFDRPQLIIFACQLAEFAQAAESISKAFPESTVLGTTTYSAYDGDASGNMTLVACGISDCVCAGGLLQEIDRYPAKFAPEIRRAMACVAEDKRPGDTICFEFTSYEPLSEDLVLDTFAKELEGTGIQVVGGTSSPKADGAINMISYNGRVYSNGCCFAFIKNIGGRIRTYQNHIYQQTSRKMIATKVDVSRRVVYEYDHQPAAHALAAAMDITLDELRRNMVQYPIGRMAGGVLHIADCRQINEDNSIAYYSRIYGSTSVAVLRPAKRPIMDMAYLLCGIRAEMPEPSFAIVINCYSRTVMAEKAGVVERCSKLITDGIGSNTIGISVYGEQFNGQHANQTMVMIVFE